MDATAAFGVAYPASAPGTGARGRGLFHTGADAETPLVTAPLDVVLCVPEAVSPGAEEDSPCAAAVRALYARWKDSTPGGLSPPDAIVDFLVRGEAPKDLRMAVALAWSRRFVPAWRRYAEEVMPAEYESLYLGTEAELEALQDETVRRMAVGSKANYAAGWAFLEEKYPAVLAAMDDAVEGDDEEKNVALAPFSPADLEWARATAHTRAMSGELGGGACAFVVPGVDLANHSFAPNATFGTSAAGDAFELRWDVEHSTKKRRKPADPRLGDEILICYGERMPNALLMLHYGFMDPENPNDQLPMECTLPGARRLGSARVAGAGRALRDAGDERAEWAARCMFAMADPTCAGGREGDLRCVAAMREAAAEWEKAAVTTIAEDEAALEDDALAPRMEMCVRYRLTQKRNVAAFGRFLDAVERAAAEEEDE